MDLGIFRARIVAEASLKASPSTQERKSSKIERKRLRVQLDLSGSFGTLDSTLLNRASGPGIVHFRGLSGPLLPQNPLEKVGGLPPPPFPSGFCCRMGPFRLQIFAVSGPMLRNNASRPEIMFPGRMLAGLRPGKHRIRPSGRPSAGRRADFHGFPVAVRPKSGADLRPGSTSA